MFASKSVKKVRKFISKFFFSEISTGVRDGDDYGRGKDVRVLSRSSIDDGEDVRVLSRSSIDDSEDVEDVDNDHDDNKSDGSSAGDDNNEGNNDTVRGTYSVGESQQLVLFREIQIIVLNAIREVWV